MPEDTDAKPCLEPSLLTADRLIEWQRGQGRRIDPVPQGIVLTYQESLFRQLRPRFRRPRQVLLARVAGLPNAADVCVAGGFGSGAAVTAMAVEELAAAGARSIVATGVAGSVSERLESAQALVVTQAICGEGASRQYGAADTASPDSELSQRLLSALARAGIEATTGAAWSTDAPYRETRAEVDRRREAGALAVDMETAALFASARALGLRAAAVLVAGDTLWGEWAPPPDAALVQRRLLQAARAAVECLRA